VQLRCSACGDTTGYNLKFDYHLFPNLKKFLRGKHFESEEEIKSEIESWILSLSENFKQAIGSK
jgi:hypothetical protein